MSGIYIKGMEMPKTCCYCPLMGYDPDREWFDSMARTGAHICALTGELIDSTKRAELCPLVPVPPHGRLIDADALSSKLTDLAENEWNQRTGTTWAGAFEDVDGFVQDAPTIIPADQAEEGET
jgi:hypothetical protein